MKYKTVVTFMWGLMCSFVCVAQPIILDWDEVAWTPTNTVGNYLIDGVRVDIEVEDTSNSLVNATPVIYSFYQGDQAAPVNALLFSSSLPVLNTNNEVVINIDLGDAGVGVEDLSFKLFDVDGEVDSFERQEKYVISGALNGMEVLPMVITGNIDVHDITNQVVHGLLPTDPVGGNSSQGVIQVSFDQPIDALTIAFSIEEGALINENSTPGFGLYDIVFSAVKPDLAIEVSNCVNGIRPDDDMVYTVTATNLSGLNVDAAVLSTVSPLTSNNISWECIVGECLLANGTGDLNEIINIQAGQSASYLLSMSLANGQVSEPFIVNAEVTAPVEAGEINTVNNSASDTDFIYNFIFKDAFECVTPSP